jgi:hypothetical protein
VAKRIALIALVALMLLVVAAPAALAAPSQQSLDRHAELSTREAPGQSGSHASNAGGNGASHAAANADKGMNRPGSAGEWKDNGHVPSVNSFPQGNAPSNPDADGNGGLDKPGQTGGFDADRDGNNGCGNDSDREDDNNGWCGKKPESPPPGGGTGGTGGSTGGGKPSTVLPKRIVALPERREAPAALPTTGTDVSDFLWGGWSLVLAGTALRRTAYHRSRR